MASKAHNEHEITFVRAPAGDLTAARPGGADRAEAAETEVLDALYFDIPCATAPRSAVAPPATTRAGT